MNFGKRYYIFKSKRSMNEGLAIRTGAFIKWLMMLVLAG